MLSVLTWLGTAYSAYRSAEDSGLWIFRLNVPEFQNYLEMFLVSKGVLP
jgi:hypothetical protein